ncbi:MAG: nucleotide exchange factor GrpE [Myxococcota bacterium]
MSEESKSSEPTDGTSPSAESQGAGPQPDPEVTAALNEAAQAVAGGGSSAAEAVTEAMIKARKELEEALEQTQKEAASLRERWMRSAADLENYRRRASKEREDVQKFGIEKLLKDFLPVLDDLDRTVQALEETQTSAPAENTEKLLGGVRLVQKKFVSTLEKHGVTTFESQGEVFNPELHEAIQQAHADLPQGAVASELQRGFKLHDRLLRPALVVVSLGPETGEESSG